MAISRVYMVTEKYGRLQKMRNLMTAKGRRLCIQTGKKQEAELVIHNKGGKISEKDSYGNDPCPPKDKK